MDTTKNMFIYNASRGVPENAQKHFDNGRFKGTDINPMWRIKKLTELFGPCGVGWYIDDVRERCETHGETTISVVTLNLYIKYNGEWSKPIYGTGGNTILRKSTTSDEAYKMAFTDAISVACKSLGIGADIWFESDKTKYTAQNVELHKEAPIEREDNYYSEVTPKQHAEAKASKDDGAPISEANLDALRKMLTEDQAFALCEKYRVESLGELTESQASDTIRKMKKRAAQA